MPDSKKQAQTSALPTRRQAAAFLLALCLFALLVRLMVAYVTVHYYDISYYIDWSLGAVWDFFGAYENIDNLDYPPLFLFPLYLTGKLLENDQISQFDQYMVLTLKGWQMLFDLALAPLLYAALRRHGRPLALGAAALWALNPVAILNSSYWGQTDCIMLFLLTLAFWLLCEKRPEWSGVVMALACLMKFQSLYFAPVYGLFFLTGGFSLRRGLQGAGAGLATVALVFLPFMQRSGWLLPWRIYTGGFKQYPAASFNAFNFYTAAGLNEDWAGRELFWGITCDQFSWAMLAGGLALLVALHFTATENSVWLAGLLFMQTVFMFTTRMHERYQIPAVLLALAACVRHKSKGLFASFLALTVMTFLNQFLVLEMVFAPSQPQAWLAHFNTIAVALSYGNLLLYGFTMFAGARVLYRHGYVRPKRPSFRRKKAGPPREAGS